MEIFNVVGVILAMTGAILVACKMRIGFGIWIISNILLLVYCIHTGNTWQCVLWAFYLVTAVFGWINWRTKDDMRRMPKSQTQQDKE